MATLLRVVFAPKKPRGNFGCRDLANVATWRMKRAVKNKKTQETWLWSHNKRIRRFNLFFGRSVSRTTTRCQQQSWHKLQFQFHSDFKSIFQDWKVNVSQPIKALPFLFARDGTGPVKHASTASQCVHDDSAFSVKCNEEAHTEVALVCCCCTHTLLGLDFKKKRVTWFFRVFRRSGKNTATTLKTLNKRGKTRKHPNPFPVKRFDADQSVYWLTDPLTHWRVLTLHCTTSASESPTAGFCASSGL